MKKFGWQWFLAVHSPVPLVFWLRLLYGVGVKLIPLFVAVFFLGQLTGGKIRRRLSGKLNLTRCLVMDAIRMLKR